MKSLTVTNKNYAKAKKVLAENGIKVILGKSNSIRKSQAKPGETPSMFGGIWKDDERTLESIREKAWPNRR